jgi:YfiH family protein
MMVDMSLLPQPSEAFYWAQAAAGPALVCRPLEPIALHLYTTRHWALGVRTAGGERGGWEQVAAELELESAQLVRVRQVHGASVVVAREARSDAADEADIIVTDAPGLGLAVRAADCVPLLIADERTAAVAAAHGGWQGLAAGVPSAAVTALTREFGSRPSDLVAAIGPSIGACCYEVGAEVRDRFEAAGFGRGRIARWFREEPRPSSRNPSMPGLPRPLRASHWFFDGWSAASEQLLDAGVPADRIFVADLCTASHPDTFCSYRREGFAAGRMVGAIRSRHGFRGGLRRGFAASP